MEFIKEFIIRNQDEIILSIVSVSIGFIIANTKKIFIWLKHKSKRFINRIRGAYSYKELKEIENTPENKRSKRQQKALAKVESELRESIKNLPKLKIK